MSYLDQKSYSKSIKLLKENTDTEKILPRPEVSQKTSKMSANLTVEEREQLQQYVASLKEIKRETYKLLQKAKHGKKIDEVGGNMMNRRLEVNEEDFNDEDSNERIERIMGLGGDKLIKIVNFLIDDGFDIEDIITLIYSKCNK